MLRRTSAEPLKCHLLGLIVLLDMVPSMMILRLLLPITVRGIVIIIIIIVVVVVVVVVIIVIVVTIIIIIIIIIIILQFLC